MPSDGKKYKFLFVSQFYYPDITACAFRIHETAKILADMGHEIHIIAGEPHKGCDGTEVHDDPRFKIIRVPLYKNTQGKWNYIRHYYSFMMGAVKAARKLDKSYDAVFVSSPPLFAAAAGWAIAYEKKSKLCIDIRDIWPESAVAAGQISKNGVLFRAAKIVEKFLYNSASVISCVSQPMAKHIASISPKAEISVIYNGIPSAMIPERPEKTAKSDKLNIFYLGNFGYCQNMVLAVEAANLLHKEGEENISFTLIGNGAEKDLIQDKIKEYGLTNIKICNVVSKEEAAHIMCSSQALMLHLKEDEILDKTIPSKVFDYLAAGKPILYGLRGEAAEILKRTGGNLFYKTPEELAKAAKELLHHIDDYSNKALGNSDIVKKEFTREAMTQKLLTTVLTKEKQ